MFQNRWGALLFVGATLAGAISLVGTGDGNGAIADATAQLEQQVTDLRGQAAPEKPAPPPKTIAPAKTASPPKPDIADVAVQEDLTEFTTSEDLVVDPIGIDPTPIMPDPEAGEIILIEE